MAPGLAMCHIFFGAAREAVTRGVAVCHTFPWRGRGRRDMAHTGATFRDAAGAAVTRSVAVGHTVPWCFRAAMMRCVVMGHTFTRRGRYAG